jgi:hypothetical protein
LTPTIDGEKRFLRIINRSGNYLALGALDVESKSEWRAFFTDKYLLRYTKVSCFRNFYVSLQQ